MRGLARWTVLAAAAIAAVAVAAAAMADDMTVSSGASDPGMTQERQIREIRQELKLLEQRVDQLENENDRLRKANAELQKNTQKLQTSTTEQISALQSKVAESPSPEDFLSAMDRFLGRYRVTLVGGAAGSFIYDRNSNINTFAFDMEPIILWQLSDKLLFEGTIEANLPAGGSADYQLPVADFQYFLNDYVELVMGIFDQPFGDWYEDQSPFWVNRFVTAPLPYNVNPLIPPTEIGVQLRGGFQWGQMGQVADYTVWSGNGPGYSNSSCTNNTPPSPLPTCTSTAFVGDTLVGVNNIKLNTHTPSFGGRFRIYPLPADSDWGRLELGVSTYDGKWANGLWMTSWGVDFNYFRDNLQTRGEWIESYRQMPAGLGADNRQGWYVQAGYFLTGLTLPFVPSAANEYIDKLEPLIRYSGINQRAAVLANIITTPEIGFTGSPALYAPHAREVALGLDYWLAPSIVWQNEFDLELPEAGGFYSDTGQPVGAYPNDRAFVSQFAVGF
ncbi:hypothetical protein IMX07_16825 [bacterium]|nr:hypothetical protein [bacterium]